MRGIYCKNVKYCYNNIFLTRTVVQNSSQLIRISAKNVPVNGFVYKWKKEDWTKVSFMPRIITLASHHLCTNVPYTIDNICNVDTLIVRM